MSSSQQAAEEERSESERMLRNSAAAFTARHLGPKRVRARRDLEVDVDRALWREMAELGWVGLTVPEAYGGLGLGLADLAHVLEELGRGLFSEPLVASAVLAAGVIARGDNERLKEDLLPQLAAGALIPALAWQEKPRGIDPADIETRAITSIGGVTVTGQKRFVRPVVACDGFIVSARSVDGIGLYWLRRDAPGLTIVTERLADGGHIGALGFVNAPVAVTDIVARPPNGAAIIAEALDRALVATSAELLGLMRGAAAMTMDYLKVRKQFGKAIGSFQALQHRAVDLYLQQELSAVALAEAVALFDEPGELRMLSAIASRVKARCSDAAMLIARESIQLHGGIGFTDEHDIGLYLKRALVLSAWLGNGSEQRRRYAGLVRAGSNRPGEAA